VKAFLWSLFQAPAPVLVGPASLLLHISATGTAPTGYAKVTWAEFAAADI
jgi:hypothetical protein